MKTLNKNTQKAENWIKTYFMSHYFSVNQFYSNPSYNKVKAEKDCINRMIELNGTGYKVLGGNCMFFTCGYMDKTENTLYIETYENTYKIPLTD
jgi:hypothetical protein